MFEQDLSFAKTIARQAGEHARRRRDESFDIELKRANDFVTEVDRENEAMIKKAVSARFPTDAFLGEEFGGQGISSSSGRVWVVDPIDGTMNFVRNIPYFSVSIALMIDAKAVVGVVFDPSRDEMFCATQNGPSLLNDVPIQTAATESLAACVFATRFSTQKESVIMTTNLEKFAVMAAASRGMRRLGSAALDLAYVASGRLDGFWEYGLSPWDTAAGALLVERAGGRVTTVDGSTFSNLESSILATNGTLHESVVKVLS